MSNVLRRLVLNNVGRNARKASGHSYIPADFKPATMDDLPVPSGSWQTDYNAKQAKYNRHLILGTGFFAVTLVVCKASGLIYLNATLPDYPSE